MLCVWERSRKAGQDTNRFMPLVLPELRRSGHLGVVRAGIAPAGGRRLLVSRRSAGNYDGKWQGGYVCCPHSCRTNLNPSCSFDPGPMTAFPLTCVKIPAGEGITCNAWGNGPRSPSYRSVHPLVHAVATFLTTEQFRTARRMRECLRRHDQPLRRSFRDSTPATCLVRKPRLQKAGLRPAPDGRRFSSSDVG